MEEMVRAAPHRTAVCLHVENQCFDHVLTIFNHSSYLHNCEPPIKHRELTCDAIFIQHNGLIKIGCIAPDVVHTHVKTRTDNNWSKNLHFIAPEISNDDDGQFEYGTPVDIYSLGMIALEMFNIELGGNGDTHVVNQELIEQSIEALEDEKQKVRIAIKHLKCPISFDI